jgi:Protein of unknown function (DUF2924)
LIEQRLRLVASATSLSKNRRSIKGSGDLLTPTPPSKKATAREDQTRKSRALDSESRRLLDGAGSPEDAGKRGVDPGRLTADVRPGTILVREWNGRMQRVTVLAEGFAWNGKIYRSLSKIAFAITGTRWNGPKFFGMRDKLSKEAR